MPIVVAKLRTQPERVNELIELYSDIVPQIHAEQGCELFALHSSKRGVTIVERWATPEDLRAHGEGTVMAEVNKRLAANPELLTEKPDIEVLQSVPLGEPTKGAIQ